MTNFDMSSFEEEFMTCLYDAPLIAVWRFDGEPDGPRYEVSVVPDVVVPHAQIEAAMDAVPEGAAWRLVLA